MSRAMYYGSAQATLIANSTFAGIPTLISGYIPVTSTQTTLNAPIFSVPTGKAVTVISFGLVQCNSAQAALTSAFTLNDNWTATSGNTVATCTIASASNTGYIASTLSTAYTKITAGKTLYLVVSSTVTALGGIGYTLQVGLADQNLLG